jgi:hypothetical protein
MTESKYRERAAEILNGTGALFPTGDFHATVDAIASLCAQVAQEVEPKGCTWTVTDDGYDTYWESTCGGAWTLIDGTPKGNEYTYCPCCGGKITEVTPPKGE